MLITVISTIGLNVLLCLQVFLLVAFCGLFHGLVFLPVALSWFGPAPYLVQRQKEKQQYTAPTHSSEKRAATEGQPWSSGLGTCLSTRESCVRIPLRPRLEGSQCHPPPQGGTGCGEMDDISPSPTVGLH